MELGRWLSTDPEVSSSYLVHVINGFSLSGIPLVNPEPVAELDGDCFEDDEEEEDDDDGFVELVVAVVDNEDEVVGLLDVDVVFDGLRAAAGAGVLVLVTVVVILSLFKLICDDMVGDKVDDVLEGRDEEEGGDSSFVVS